MICDEFYVGVFGFSGFKAFEGPAATQLFVGGAAQGLQGSLELESGVGGDVAEFGVEAFPEGLQHAHRQSLFPHFGEDMEHDGADMAFPAGFGVGCNHADAAHPLPDPPNPLMQVKDRGTGDQLSLLKHPVGRVWNHELQLCFGGVLVGPEALGVLVQPLHFC